MPDSDSRARFDAEELTAFTAVVLLHYGVPAEDAARAAAVLVDADLSGIESHGIADLPWHEGYVPGFEKERINPHPRSRCCVSRPFLGPGTPMVHSA